MDKLALYEIREWMCKKENMEKLSDREKIQISEAIDEYTEKIAPIILKHMAGIRRVEQI